MASTVLSPILSRYWFQLCLHVSLLTSFCPCRIVTFQPAKKSPWRSPIVTHNTPLRWSTHLDRVCMAQEHEQEHEQEQEAEEDVNKLPASPSPISEGGV